MQDRPICFGCDKAVETNAEILFEAPCGHDGCSSAVFHPLCLMEYRETRDKWVERIAKMRAKWLEEHRDREADEDA